MSQAHWAKITLLTHGNKERYQCSQQAQLVPVTHWYKPSTTNNTALVQGFVLQGPVHPARLT